MEPFWGFNVIFGLPIFALFAIEQKVLQSKRGEKEGGHLARDNRHGKGEAWWVTYIITFLQRLIELCTQ